MLLLKPLIVAAGALLTVTVVSSAPASAAGYPGRASVAPRAGDARTGYAATRSTRIAPRARYTAAHVYRAPRLSTIGGARRVTIVRSVAAYRTVARSRFVLRMATVARHDRLIRNAVAPRSAYVTTATPAVGGGQVGRASYYALASRTASGDRVGGATCAHPSLPFGTRVLVTNLANAHHMVLTVNDRGPFIGGRILDVSRGAAGFLGMLGSGTAPVRIQVVGHS